MRQIAINRKQSRINQLTRTIRKRGFRTPFVTLLVIIVAIRRGCFHRHPKVRIRHQIRREIFNLQQLGITHRCATFPIDASTHPQRVGIQHHFPLRQRRQVAARTHFIRDLRALLLIRRRHLLIHFLSLRQCFIAQHQLTDPFRVFLTKMQIQNVLPNLLHTHLAEDNLADQLFHATQRMLEGTHHRTMPLPHLIHLLVLLH
mmetsp:Transcript_15684/g.23999  ORF Transcript_15684/g.23999 Transcript_15684/m.23999 type:complete len:202 (-) Transcript_15684:1422-2027(-)